MQRCCRARRPGRALDPVPGILSLTFLLASVGCAAAQDGLVHHPERGVYSVEYVDDYGDTRRMEIVPPNRISPVVAVTIIDHVRHFEYRYDVTNGTGRLVDQPIGRIELACPSVVPDDALSAPESWIAESRQSVYVDQHTCWYVARTGGVAPGTTLTGIVVRSRHLPGVVDLRVWGRKQDIEYYPGIFDARPELSELVSTVNGVDGGWFEGATVGPAIDPDTVSQPEAGLAALRFSLDRACREHWLDEGLCRGLRAEVEKAESSMPIDRPVARRHLQTFLDDLEAQRGRQDDENAYWLLSVLGKHVASTMSPPSPDIARPSSDPSAIIRLDPLAIPQLPIHVARSLHDRACTVPQAWDGWSETPNNFVKGDFGRTGATDWAVLCSDGEVSRIVVVWGDTAACPSELAEGPDAGFVYEMEGEPAFARSIAAPGASEGHGIEDVFQGKGSVTHHCRDGVWEETRSSD